MITPNEYTVMGEDGKEYGPVADSQIREWIREGRLGPKTPVKPADAKDWIFLADVPDFASFFAPKPTQLPKPPLNKTLMHVAGTVAVLTILYYLISYLLTLKKH